MSEAISSSPGTSNPGAIQGALYILTQLEERPRDLGEVAYGWCAMICRNRHRYQDWETLLLTSLEVGFRHVRQSGPRALPTSTGAEHQQEIFDAVLGSGNNEAVTDLICASLMTSWHGGLGLSICANYILDHRGGATGPLREIFVSCVWRVDSSSSVLEKVGKGRFVELLNRLHISNTDLRCASHYKAWTAILLETIRTAEEARRLDIQSWELLAELVTIWRSPSSTYNPDVSTFLVDGKEWDKLECWMSVVWMAWPPEPGNVVKELEDVMELLEKERPGAVRKRMDRWSEQYRRDVPESFKQTCDKLALWVHFRFH